MGIWNKIKNEYCYQNIKSIENGGRPWAKVRLLHSRWAVFTIEDDYKDAKRWCKSLKEAKEYVQKVYQ